VALFLILAIGARDVRAQACPNEAFRVGPSANLPDCRAYELVTPANTNGSPPHTVGAGAVRAGADEFSSPPAAPGGDSYMFSIFGTALPGTEGGGYANAYRARRGAAGWTTLLWGPSGQQAAVPSPGGYSSDHEYQSFRVPYLEGRFSGSLALGTGRERERPAGYVRYPDGSIHLLGEGTLPIAPDTDGFSNGLADDPEAVTRWIASGGSHIIFDTSRGEFPPVPLLPDAPSTGIAAVYDRTPAGLHTISLLPENVTPTADSVFKGASSDGSTVLFSNNSTLYVRLDNTTTEALTSGGFISGGVSRGGEKVFYAQGGNLFSFDTRARHATQINTSGDAEFVNVSADGSHVFFISPSQLNGSQGTKGAANLYVWDGATITLIATVAIADLVRLEGGTEVGLTQWASGPAKNSHFLINTSRVNLDGEAFVFESVAQLTAYDNGGHREIYRYGVADKSLKCISCSPTDASALAGAALADYGPDAVYFSALMPNLTDDGQVVLFQSGDALVAADSNGVTDVYEWRDGQVSLISSGRSSQPSIFMGMTPSGNDVFVRTTDKLVPAGQEAGVPAIYDARVGGGFPTLGMVPASCIADACQGRTTSPPDEPAGGSSSFMGRGNQPRRVHKPRCARGHHAKRKKHMKRCKERRHANRGFESAM
jgi:hypothetical protein